MKHPFRFSLKNINCDRTVINSIVGSRLSLFYRDPSQIISLDLQSSNTLTSVTMGGHHESEIKIPDYKIYKVDNVPDLVIVKNILAKEGLKDPWLRNEVWRFPPTNGSRYEQYFKSWFRGKRGISIGLGLATTVVIAEKVYDHFYPPAHHHKKPYYPSSSVEL